MSDILDNHCLLWYNMGNEGRRSKMVFGVAGGMIISGMLLGAFAGSIWLLLGFSAAGFAVAAAAEAAKLRKDKEAASCKLSQYPPYGY